MNNSLIGKQVIHRKSRARGVITDVYDKYVFVDINGKEVRFPYPGAFSNALMLEDSGDIPEGANEASFEDFCQRYSWAIKNEIDHLKKTGGKHYRAFDGVVLERKEYSTTYLFEIDSELHFPDGTMIRIWLSEEIISAAVISCDDFMISFRTSSPLPSLSVIEFTAESWRLLEALYDRLSEMKISKNAIAYKLACEGRFLKDERSQIVYGQDHAIGRVTKEPITFIWGPPGTGKTTTLARIAMNFISQGKRVLMVSYSNVSVDGALLKVANMCPNPEGVAVRYGNPRTDEIIESDYLFSRNYVLSKYPKELSRYIELYKKTRKSYKIKESIKREFRLELASIKKFFDDEEYILIHKAPFVATTISKATVDPSIYEQRFDLVIFDEASMAYVPQIVFAGGLSKSRFCCLGDFSQLPAIVQSRDNEVLERDIFEYTGITAAVDQGCGHEWLVMLKTQYRMHPDIAAFASKRMYHNLLVSAFDMEKKRQQIADLAPVSQKAVSMIDISGMYSVCTKTSDGSRINLLSALLCMRIAEIISRQYKVGIITPYSAQSRLMMAMVRDLSEVDERYKRIRTATVHQFQGSEEPVIIYDAVDCYRMKYPGVLLTALKNDTANRLFNVALTRAQGKFILVANRDFYIRKHISENLMFTNIMNSLVLKDAACDGDSIMDTITLEEDKNDYIRSEYQLETWEQYLDDLDKAEKSIAIEIPGLIDDDDEYLSELEKSLNASSKRGVAVTVRQDNGIILPTFLQQYTSGNKELYVTTPVTIIDRKIIWYGQPLCSADFVSEGEIIPTEYPIAFRFTGLHTAKLLKLFLG